MDNIIHILALTFIGFSAFLQLKTALDQFKHKDEDKKMLIHLCNKGIRDRLFITALLNVLEPEKVEEVKRELNELKIVMEEKQTIWPKHFRL